MCNRSFVLGVDGGYLLLRARCLCDDVRSLLQALDIIVLYQGRYLLPSLKSERRVLIQNLRVGFGHSEVDIVTEFLLEVLRHLSCLLIPYRAVLKGELSEVQTACLLIQFLLQVRLLHAFLQCLLEV